MNQLGWRWRSVRHLKDLKGKIHSGCTVGLVSQITLYGTGEFETSKDRDTPSASNTPARLRPICSFTTDWG